MTEANPFTLIVATAVLSLLGLILFDWLKHRNGKDGNGYTKNRMVIDSLTELKREHKTLSHDMVFVKEKHKGTDKAIFQIGELMESQKDTTKILHSIDNKLQTISDNTKSTLSEIKKQNDTMTRLVAKIKS